MKKRYITKLLVAVTLDSEEWERPSTDQELTKEGLAKLVQQGRDFKIVDGMSGRVTKDRLNSPIFGEFIGGNWLQEGKVRCPKCGSKETICYLGYNELSQLKPNLILGGSVEFTIGNFQIECKKCNKYYLFGFSGELPFYFIEEGEITE